MSLIQLAKSIVSPDKTFGKGFYWTTAAWFNAKGLNDVQKYLLRLL